jgi:CubicO group peptidase (beta-lactamase class C family)
MQQELAQRLPARPWSDLLARVPPGALEGFGGPLDPTWRVAGALLLADTLYYLQPDTPYGPYPYPLEMRFGVRSVTKGVFAPLSLLHLAQQYGARVFSLGIGHFVPGLDPKWQRVRFIDAANMVTGFGGVGSTCIQPNDILDGYLAGNYDAWYTAASMADKIDQINTSLCPYPWEPGSVMRYRDQDYFLLGVALDAFLKSVRGPTADLGEMLRAEVFEPIGIHQVPLVRTREAGGRDGVVWCNAGYYPTLDDLAKIGLLYQSGGAHAGKQILDRQATCDLLRARDAVVKDGQTGLYKLGFHFPPPECLPSMRGSGNNEVILHPAGLISIVIAKASEEVLGSTTPRVLARLARLRGHSGA